MYTLARVSNVLNYVYNHNVLLPRSYKNFVVMHMGVNVRLNCVILFPFMSPVESSRNLHVRSFKEGV